MQIEVSDDSTGPMLLLSRTPAGFIAKRGAPKLDSVVE